jgi:hypothetical protein
MEHLPVLGNNSAGATGAQGKFGEAMSNQRVSTGTIRAMALASPLR